MVRKFVLGALISAIGTIPLSASATDLSAQLNVDDYFSYYISTSDAVLGTLIGSSSYGNWPTTFSFDTALTANVTNYIHIVATNGGGPAGFLGTFSLSDTQFVFANGTQSLLTGDNAWKVNTSGFGNVMSDTVVSGGLNGVSPWGFRSGQSSSAKWIWTIDAQNNADIGSVYFSAAINPVPEPETYAMLLAGLGIVGTIARKKKLSD